MMNTHLMNDKVVDNIVSDFVDSVRLEQRSEELQEKEWRKSSSVEEIPGLEEARSHGDKAVIEAEKFCAEVAAPNPGTDQIPYDSNINTIPNIGVGVSDDDFFHLTCHIDPTLIHKIENGEFIELEKLLPKDKLGSRNEENRLEWVQRDGGTFLVPAQKDSNISNFRRWEQAFRAYATIYCRANPHRAKEIWQYVTVINTAASSYIWDNVYNYNIIFCHLMAFNPSRSWAVTYNQMWNLSMRDPIPRGNNNSGQRFGGSFGNYPNNSYRSNSGKGGGPTGGATHSGKKKSDYCWNFNKGVPCRFGTKCKFIERCKYCDSPSHGVNACNELLKKLDGGSSTSKPNQDSRVVENK